MNMKRRNGDCAKLRRTIKKNKISDSFYGSTFLYLKFLLVWSLVLSADFIIEFRFEYLWPFWLFVRSVFDSFKYQGLAFSVFFTFLALTSDMLCFMFIPVHWLFFAASTYVWVQYVWHTERGVCLPTVSLWLLFIYIEASVRLKELKNLPFHLDLCRPFAAHCIGYPVVTLGFGCKSYVNYRMRLRKQKEVAKENSFYMEILDKALPPRDPAVPVVGAGGDPYTYNGCAVNGAIPGTDTNGVPLMVTANNGYSMANGNVHNNQSLVTHQHLNNSHLNHRHSNSSANNNNSDQQHFTNSNHNSSNNQQAQRRSSDTNCTYNNQASDQNANASPVSEKKRNDLQNIPSNSQHSSSLKENHLIKRIANFFDFDIISSSLTSSIGKSVNNAKDEDDDCAENNSNESKNETAKDKTLKQSSVLNNLSSLKNCSHASRNSNQQQEHEHDVSRSSSTASSHKLNNSISNSSSTLAGVLACQSSNNSSNKGSKKPSTLNVSVNNLARDDQLTKLQSDVKRLASEMDIKRQTEVSLRSQITTLSIQEKNSKNELIQLQQDNEGLQQKLHNLVIARQQDKQTMAGLEKKYADEKKLRAVLEKELEKEKKAKKALEDLPRAAGQSINSTALLSGPGSTPPATPAVVRLECSDSCKSRKRDMEAELKSIKRELKLREDQIRTAEREAHSLRQYKDSHGEAEVLMSALSAMQDKNSHLESSLSAETRLKLDLFSALGETKRQLELTQAQLERKNRELDELKSKIAEVMAIMPSSSNSSGISHHGPLHTFGGGALLGGTTLQQLSEMTDVSYPLPSFLLNGSSSNGVTGGTKYLHNPVVGSPPSAPSPSASSTSSSSSNNPATLANSGSPECSLSNGNTSVGVVGSGRVSSPNGSTNIASQSCSSSSSKSPHMTSVVDSLKSALDPNASIYQPQASPPPASMNGSSSSLIRPSSDL